MTLDLDNDLRAGLLKMLSADVDLDNDVELDLDLDNNLHLDVDLDNAIRGCGP